MLTRLWASCQSMNATLQSHRLPVASLAGFNGRSCSKQLIQDPIAWTVLHIFEGFGSLKCAGAFHPLCMGGMAQGKKRTCSAGFDFGGAIVLSTVRTRIRKLSHAAAESSGLMDALPLFTGRASDATVGLS